MFFSLSFLYQPLNALPICVGSHPYSHHVMSNNIHQFKCWHLSLPLQRIIKNSLSLSFLYFSFRKSFSCHIFQFPSCHNMEKKKHYDCLLCSKWTIWVYNFFLQPIASYPFLDLILYYHILMLITFLKTLSNSFYNWLMREALTYQERQCVSVWTRAEKNLPN